MKLIIDIPNEYFEQIKNSTEGSTAESEAVHAIRNGIPYEELSHEQECIIEELENICINNEYVLDLLAKLKNKETPKGNLIQSLTELCNKYCKNCPVTGEADDCTDCLIIHKLPVRCIVHLVQLRGIMDGVNKNETDH